MTKKNKLLMPEGRGIVCLTELAIAFGVEGALVLQQIYYLTNFTDAGVYKNGERFIYNSYQQWKEEHFPYWSERTIQRILLRLEKEGALESAQLHGNKSRVKSYKVSNKVITVCFNGREAV